MVCTQLGPHLRCSAFNLRVGTSNNMAIVKEEAFDREKGEGVEMDIIHLSMDILIFARVSLTHMDSFS